MSDPARNAWLGSIVCKSHERGTPPTRDCPESPNYAAIASLLNYAGELTDRVKAILRQWTHAGQPLRNEAEIEALGLQCSECNDPVCRTFLRMANWSCPKQSADRPPPAGKDEEEMKAEQIEAMRKIALALTEVDETVLGKRLEICSACTELQWLGCSLPCSCADRWAKWRERVCSGKCNHFNQAMAESH